MFQEGFPFDRANARQRIQSRGHALLRPPRPVRGNGKAMCFVADALDKIKPLRMARQQQQNQACWGKKSPPSAWPGPPPALYQTIQIFGGHPSPGIIVPCHHPRSTGLGERQTIRPAWTRVLPLARCRRVVSPEPHSQRLKRRVSTSSMLAKSSGAPIDPSTLNRR